MSTINIKMYLIASALLLLMGSTAHATTRSVNCETKNGFNSIGAALKALQSSDGPNTINVSGTCYENGAAESIPAFARLTPKVLLK